MNNQSNIFYYFSDKTKTDSKLIALEFEKLKKDIATFYYHDDIFNLYNWKIEPPLSLDFYYLEQAKKIRDEYDYVILCYSGGIDSTNILDTFFYNNIKLDKIVTVGALSQDEKNGDDSNRNGELYHNVFPYIKDLGLNNLLHTIDYTTYFSDIKKFTLYHTNWVEKTGNWFSPHHWFWYDIDKYVIDDYMKNKKIAIIFGKDRPYLKVDENGLYFQFSDVILNAYGFQINRDVDIINFYWDPSFPFILIKQLHILKKYFQKSHTQINTEKIKQLIYTLKRPLNYISIKSPSTVLSLRDSYIINNKNSDVFDMYVQG
jgi:hypothetical protein